MRDESKPQQSVQLAVPVLKATEQQYECKICWCTVPESNINKHIDWHQKGHEVA